MRWYFDFISPFAYLQSTRLEQMARHEEVEFRPILFAGLLKHWGQLGPAEMKTKRQWTFEHCVWQAHRDGIPLTLPPEHPFNPLPLLRLCVAACHGCNANEKSRIVQQIFRYIWVDGQLPTNQQTFTELCEELGLGADEINSDRVKQELKDNGETAISEGVFGVPTTISNGKLYWGYDATDMLLASFNSNQPDSTWPAAGIAAVANLPEGLQRKR